MSEAIRAFHFIRPLWLLALIPLGLLAWRLARDEGEDPWTRIVDAPLLQLLHAGGAQAPGRAATWLLAAGWIIAVLALADPTWERRPQPVYQTDAARVVVLDLSDSMYASDLKPSRLVRARYAIEDVLALGTEGQTGLVAYAGEAFTVSPLTRDANTIRALLTVLEPSLMPAPGSRADLGLSKAGELLRHAGATDGQVLLIADGVDPDKLAASERAAAQLKREGYRVSVLGVGTAQGAPITDAQGRLVRDSDGRIINTRMDAAQLEAVAVAGGGRYRAIDDDGSALRALLEAHAPLHGTRLAHAVSGARGWKAQGPLLALLLLPLAALAFRRNWLLVLLCAAGLSAPARPAMASTWSDLWQRPDQQAAAALAAGDYARAAKLAPDPARRGSAQYRRGDYLHALESFSKDQGANADYNRGNALARMGRYQEAVVAYAQALKARPGMDDARANKAAVEALLKKQPQQEQSAQAPGKNENGKNGKDGNNANQTEPQAGETKQANAAAKPQATQTAGARAAGAQQPPEKSFADAAKKLADAGARKSASEPPSTPSSAQPAPRGPKADPDSAAQKLDSEEQMAAEQWLRRIPDDPGGLLRRKFLYQYRQRAQQSGGG